MSGDLHPEWVDTADGVRRAADLCRETGRVALDTEADSMHSYFHKVCLIQVTANGRHLIIDPLRLEPGDLDPLWAVVGDPSIPVLMHGADYDIRVLDRDYGARVSGLQDTQIMALLLGEEKTGLAALLDKELGVKLDKKYQRANWGRRPLTRSQVVYAAADTAYLGRLTKLLRVRLEDLGRWSWAVEEFHSLERVRHTPVEPDPLAFERIKGARNLRGRSRNVLFALHRWRERTAQSLDVPPFKVLGNRQLLMLAENPPGDLEAIGEVDGVGPRAVRRWGRQILDRIRRPGHAPEHVKMPRPQKVEPSARLRMKNLMAVRDATATEFGIQGGILCPRACVEAVACRRPPCSTLEDLSAAGLTGWRLEVLGSRFLATIREP